MRYIKRHLEDKIVSSLLNPRALFILGARQVGKTSLLKRMIEIVGNDQSVYLDLENPDHLRGLSGSISDAVAYINSFLSSNHKRHYILIDEIQYMDDFSKTIKYLVDHYSEQFKLIMTGSSSIMIKKSFTESLVGRKDIFELYPLTFSEYCLFKGEERIAELLNTMPLKLKGLYSSHAKLNRLLADYIIYGGYPQIVLTDDRNERISLLRDIISSYILKDVKYLFRIEKIDQFNHLIQYLAINIGKELNIRSIATEIGLYWDTVQKHLLALDESYIIDIIRPFHKNLTTELKQMPKIYFIDTGVRNAILNSFNELQIRPDRGELFENYVFNQLSRKRNITTDIKYWKTKSGMEIDFIALDEDMINAYETKYGNSTKNNFTAFHNAYPNAQYTTVRFTFTDKAGDVPGWGI